MKCGRCGYDMWGTPVAERCPECGAADWTIVRDGWPSGERVSLIAAASPVACLALIHLLFVVLRIEFGHWPCGILDSASSSTQCGAIAVFVAMPMTFVCVVAAAVNAVIVPSLLGLALLRRGAWSAALRTLAVAMLCWGPALLLAYFDPAGALA